MKKNLLERTDEERKETPVLDGCLAYFPNAIVAVADNSMAGQKQHAPDEPLKWYREKSQDELGSLQRHIVDFLLAEKKGDREEMLKASKAIAWRGLAHCERMIAPVEVDPARYQIDVPATDTEVYSEIDGTRIVWVETVSNSIASTCSECVVAQMPRTLMQCKEAKVNAGRNPDKFCSGGYWRDA